MSLAYFCDEKDTYFIHEDDLKRSIAVDNDSVLIKNATCTKEGRMLLAIAMQDNSKS